MPLHGITRAFVVLDHSSPFTRLPVFLSDQKRFFSKKVSRGPNLLLPRRLFHHSRRIDFSSPDCDMLLRPHITPSTLQCHYHIHSANQRLSNLKYHYCGLHTQFAVLKNLRENLCQLLYFKNCIIVQFAIRIFNK